MSNFPIADSVVGHVVEFFRLPSSVRTGIVGNLPKERRTARVVFVRNDGTLNASGPNGEVVILSVEEITKDLGKAQAGWAAW